MAKRLSNAIAAYLKRCGTIIKNSLSDEEIQAAVGNYGYTTDKLNQGQALLDAANDSVDTREKTKGAEEEETDQAKSLRKTAETAYESLAKIARTEFRGQKEQLVKLGLNGEMPRTIAGFIESGKTLFNNALADDEIKTALAKYNYSVATLTSEKQKILDFESEYDAEVKAKGTAKQSTSGKKDAVGELKTWMSQYINIAKIALANNKGALTKLGIAARTTKTKAQRSAPKKAAATKAAKKVKK